MIALAFFFCWRRGGSRWHSGVKILDLADEGGSKEVVNGTAAVPVENPYVAVPLTDDGQSSHPESSEPTLKTSASSNEKASSLAPNRAMTSTSLAASSSSGASSAGESRSMSMSQVLDAGMMREMSELREEIARMRMREAAKAGGDEESIAEVLDAAPPPEYDEPSHSRFSEQERPESQSIFVENDLSESAAHGQNE